MNDRPTALRLADVARLSRHDEWHRQADAELRRLYDVLGKSQALNRIREARIKELEKQNAALLEACAKVCEALWSKCEPKDCAVAIRARGNNA